MQARSPWPVRDPIRPDDPIPDMPQKLQTTLSRRERQIMDILYRLGRATGADVMAALPGDPSYSTVRTQLRVLEKKGHVRHEEHGAKFIYLPAVPRRAARNSALRHLVDTFFDGWSSRSSARSSAARVRASPRTSSSASPTRSPGPEPASREK